MWQNKRSNEKEIMDYGLEQALYTLEEYNDCLQKLSWINTLLGGYRATKKALEQIEKPESILEIGCGGGYLALRLHHWFKDADIVGIDIERRAVDHAAKHLRETFVEKVSFQVQPDKSLDYPDNSFDVVTTMLVCHHMTDEELVQFLKESYRVASKAVIINDLQRHFAAYCGFSLIAKFFRNRLIWHDGRLSIKRSFRRKEWIAFLEKGGFQQNQYTLKWNWAFRWTLILYPCNIEKTKEKRHD